MPRILPERPRRLFRGAEFIRLMTMIVMLFVLGMMIKTAQDPDTWKWLVSKPGKPDQVVAEGNSNEPPERERVPAQVRTAPAAPASSTTSGTSPANSGTTASPANSDGQFGKPAEKPSAAVATTGSQAPAPTPKLPPATGPTDEDESEAIASEEDFDFVADNAVEIYPEEKAAYGRLCRWVINQPYERLAARAMAKNPSYSAFVTSPEEFRQPGKIFSFLVHVRMALKFDVKLRIQDEDDPHEPVTLYEMWGYIDQAPGRFFHFLVYDPPAGLPLGKDLREDVRFVGYFFRVQGYIPAKAGLNARVQPAPSFIGRIAWKAREPGVVLQSSELPWLIGIAGGVAVILLGWLTYILLSRRNVAQTPMNLPPPPALTVENWLDRVESGEEAPEDENGYSDANAAEFEQPHTNGHSNGSGRRFSDPRDEG